MDSKEDAGVAAHRNETDSEDSDFEDALEELVIASGIESSEGTSKATSAPCDSESQAQSSDSRERQVAEEFVNDVIASAQKVMTSSGGDVTTDNDVKSKDASQTTALYQDIPADDTETADTEEGHEESRKEETHEKEKTDKVGKEEGEEHIEEKEPGESDDEEDERFVIDEEFLKEREANLTDEEKQELKEKAQAHKSEGNDLFKEHNFAAALVSYTDALRTCPLSCAKERSIMYSNRAACKMHMDQKESAIEDSTKALELNPNYMKCLLRRAELYEKTDKLDEALGDYQKALEMDPGLHVAREACMRLPDQIKERNEKLKEEMMGKLKDLGNLVLRPFGLSTENFKLNQDPATGGYSVQFQQNQGGS